MEEFPFTEAEWATAREAIWGIVKAGSIEDTVVEASCLVELLEVLTTLRKRYGDHPVLLETEADFIDDESERIELYQRAIDIAIEEGLPTETIRESLIRLRLNPSSK